MPPDAAYTIADLARLTGLNVRTIRYYLAQGLIPASGESGPGAHYGEGHLDRLRLTKRLQTQHLPLAEIRRRLADLSDEDAAGLLASEVASPPAQAGSALDYIRSVLGSTDALAGRVKSVPIAAFPMAPVASATAPSTTGRLPALPHASLPGSALTPPATTSVPPAGTTLPADEAVPPAGASAPADEAMPPARGVSLPAGRRLLAAARLRMPATGMAKGFDVVKADSAHTNVAEANVAEAAPGYVAMPVMRDAPAQSPSTLPQLLERSQWERLSLAPNIELHVRRPLSRLEQRRVERLITIARQVLHEDQS